MTFTQSILAEGEILVVQSISIPPYDEALKGFISTSHPEITHLDLSKIKKGVLKKTLKKTSPSVILSIGRDALMSVKDIRDIPVIYLMVLDPQSVLTHDDNFYGIRMNISPEKHLEIFTRTIPGINKIGLLYNPDNTGDLVEKTRDAAKKKDIILIPGEASAGRDIPRLLKDIADKIDALWMLPDINLMTPEAIELLLIVSVERGIPILTFSDKYVEIGALMSVAVDPYDMGRQAGEITDKLLRGDYKGKGFNTFARKGVIVLNKKIAEKLGIELKSEPDLELKILK